MNHLRPLISKALKLDLHVRIIIDFNKVWRVKDYQMKGFTLKRQICKIRNNIRLNSKFSIITKPRFR